MTLTSYINPFSEEAKQIVIRMGNIATLDTSDKNLIKVIQQTQGQKQSKDNPTTIKQLAIKKYEWYEYAKTKKYEEDQYKYLTNPDITDYDTVAFYLLCQAIAIYYGTNSLEAMQLYKMEEKLLLERFEMLNNNPQKKYEIIKEILSEFTDSKNTYWYDIKDLLKIGNIDVNQLILKNGRIIMDLDDFAENFSNKIVGRSIESVYDIIIGDVLQTKLIIAYIISQTQQYMHVVEEMTNKIVEPNEIMKDIAESVKNTQQEAQKLRYSNKPINSNNPYMVAQPMPYDPEAFPPCIRKCLEGIKSGGRNDAIVLFLTPFMSYARLCPGIFVHGQNRKIKVSDMDPNLEITNNEVIPLIYNAASACRPPLFKDQPQEKININSKLGFGMHDTLERDHEGETLWYTPMSCEKIKLHMPHICIPRPECKDVKNPLTYYNRKYTKGEK